MAPKYVNLASGKTVSIAFHYSRQKIWIPEEENKKFIPFIAWKRMC